MRFASSLFVAVSLVTVASVALVRQRPVEPRGRSVLVQPPDETAVRRLSAKAAVARRLAGGEVTLREAAAWFRRFDSIYASPRSVASPEDANLPEAQRYCRMALRWAVADAREEPTGQAEAVSRRLNAELDAALATGRPIELPDVP